MKESVFRGVGNALVFLTIYLVFVGAASAQVGTISGKVLDENGEPLPGANVTIVGTMRGASANAEGAYSFRVEAGTYTVRATFIGYASQTKEVTVVAGETVTVDFTLAESAVEFGESLVVVGSRSARTATETPVPVDVISAQTLELSGQLELNQTLTYVAPSYTANHQTIADGTDHINPASLRGLAPDQVLVLVNGKRRHPVALVHVNGTFGRGSVAVDLNSIPQSSIERVEVLRDGAAALYGSDAIAGVINLVLKEQTQKLQMDVTTGVTGEGDGEQVEVSANYGFNLGDRGFFNVTAQYLDRGRTNRSDPYQGPIFFTDRAQDDAEIARRGLTRRDFSMKTGQAAAEFGALFFNSAYSITENAELYAFGGLSFRNGMATGFYRRPIQEARVVYEIYPNGFLPEIHTKINDRAFTAGLRGNKNGWDVDLSFTNGRNSFKFNIENSNNASMGAASPTTFDAGTLHFEQWIGNLDIVRPLNVEGVNSMNLAFGSEFRVENYQIVAGEFASYSLGNGGDVPGVDFDTTSTGSPKAAGSQVFPGFQPANEVDRYRNSISVYANLETEVNDWFLIDLAGRFENYSDFGSRVTGKIASRLEIMEDVALRAALSTGFRAPSLHQVWFNNISTQFVIDPATNELFGAQVLTANNLSNVTKAFGIPNLTEETSVNVSAGFTARPHPKLSLTTDFYYITIDNRIVLTSRFSSSNPTFAEILKPFEPFGVSRAQFFANVVDTRTRGLDVVAAYFTPIGSGRLDVTLAANFTKTEVTAVNIPETTIRKFEEANGRPPTASELQDIRNTLFNREERNRLEDALPREKGNLTVRYSQGPWSFLVRAAYFGDVKYKPTNPANDETFSAKTLFDLDLGYEFLNGVRLSVGASNLFNTFPDKHQKAANYSNGNFPYSRRVTQFGINGGFYYGRLQFRL